MKRTMATILIAACMFAIGPWASSAARAEYIENWDTSNNNWSYWDNPPPPNHTPMVHVPSGGAGGLGDGYVKTPLSQLVPAQIHTLDALWPAYLDEPTKDPDQRLNLNNDPIIKVRLNDLGSANLQGGAVYFFIGTWVDESNQVFWRYNEPLTINADSWAIKSVIDVRGGNWVVIVHDGMPGAVPEDFYNDPPQYGFVIQGQDDDVQLTGELGFDSFANVTDPQGCCLQDGRCLDLSPAECSLQGGQLQGPETTCTEEEACCLDNGDCREVDPLCCDDIAGSPSPSGQSQCLTDLNGNGIDDACEVCAPKPDQSACESVVCPDPAQSCMPRCLNYNPTTGRILVVDCECRYENDCHVEPDLGPGCQGGCPPGTICEETRKTLYDETIDICCDCVPQPCEPKDDGSGCRQTICPIPDQACLPKIIRKSAPDPSFPPAGVDILDPVTGSVSLQNQSGAVETVPLTGSMTIQREEPVETDTIGTFQAEIVSMELSGDSASLGLVTVNLVPYPRSTGKTIGSPEPGNDFPADSFFDVFVEIDLPGLCGSNNQPLPLQSLGINSVPPWGDTYETQPGWAGAALLDQDGLTTGYALTDLNLQLPPDLDEWKVIDCECMDPEMCHLEISLAAAPDCVGPCPPGQICQQLIIENSDGSIDMQCVCDQELTEYGDAPEGGIAYPSTGLIGEFPTCRSIGPAAWIQHNIETPNLYFGDSADSELDGNAGACPNCFPPYDRDECYNDGDAGLLIQAPYTIRLNAISALEVVPCSGTATTLGSVCNSVDWGVQIDMMITNATDRDAYVNVLMDWDQNGKWAYGTPCMGSTAAEHVLKNFPVPAGFAGQLSALNPPGFQLGRWPGYIWARFTIANERVAYDEPIGWNGQGTFVNGETEDYLLKVVPKPPVKHLKWSQPPVETDPTSRIPTYCGWDEPSYTLTAQPLWHMVADDFRCLGSMPVTSVHWWGSYLNWRQTEPPAQPLKGWKIAFWTNVPAPVGGGYSYPEKPLHVIDIPPDRVEVEWVGDDFFPDILTESCFQYYVKLQRNEYFWQGKFSDSVRDNAFWISITAVYEGADVVYPWGWKTRPWHWMDDAVTFVTDEEPIQGGPPLNPDINQIQPLEALEESFDAAFELDTHTDWIKWEQPFTGIRRWPHYEDRVSMAREDDNGNVVFDSNMVADDWKCTKRTPITAVVWWGSYIGYQYNACQVLQMRPVKPDYFLLRIWTDVPAGGVPPYSHPGHVVWKHKAYEFDEVLVGYDKHPHTIVREPVFRYSVRLPESEWFLQRQRETIYWLSIAAVYKAGTDPSHRWGWTNHAHVFNDNAVTGTYLAANDEWQWSELFDQTDAPEDLSFVLFSDHCPCRGDMDADGWLSSADVSIMVSTLLPHASNYYWLLVPESSCGDMDADGWLSPEDVSILVNTLLPHASNHYWLRCP